MNLSYSVAPSDLLWTDDLFNYIQSFKAGGFDSSSVYEQFGWLVVPEIEAHGSAGPFTAYFAIKAGDSVTPFSIFNPLTNVAVWTVENHLPAVNILAASNLNLSFLSILAAGSATALEKLLFDEDDMISFDAGDTRTAAMTCCAAGQEMTRFKPMQAAGGMRSMAAAAMTASRFRMGSPAACRE